MGQHAGAELYDEQLVALLQTIWGRGWLSPGGPEEVKLILDGVDLADKAVLDIGCGAGGIEAELVSAHGAGFVTGLDVEDTVLGLARQTARDAGIACRCGFIKAAPGPLPFPPSTFDVIFSKDSIVHIPDKESLMRDVFRVLKPGGWFAASAHGTTRR